MMVVNNPLIRPLFAGGGIGEGTLDSYDYIISNLYHLMRSLKTSGYLTPKSLFADLLPQHTGARSTIP